MIMMMMIMMMMMMMMTMTMMMMMMMMIYFNVTLCFRVKVKKYNTFDSAKINKPGYQPEITNVYSIVPSIKLIQLA